MLPKELNGVNVDKSRVLFVFRKTQKQVLDAETELFFFAEYIGRQIFFHIFWIKYVILFLKISEINCFN